MRLEEQRSGGGIVDDAVMRIMRRRPDEEFAHGKGAPGEAMEPPGGEMDRIDAMGEVGDQVEIARAERRREAEDVTAGAAAERVDAAATVEHIVAEPAGKEVVAE